MVDNSAGLRLQEYLSNFVTASKRAVKNDLKKSEAIDTIYSTSLARIFSHKTWPIEFFGNNSAAGSYMILDGLQKELYNIGIITFEN